MHKNNKGFTFVELITATVMLALAVAGVYAAFLSAARFVGLFRHEIQAVVSTQGYLDRESADNKFQDLETTFTQPTASTWPLDPEVNDLDATSTVETDIDLGSGAGGYNFKRIDTTVTWDERQI